MKERFGFIGCGNMGGALARAACRGAGPQQVLISGRTPEKVARLAEELGCRPSTNEEIAQTCDFIFLGVKPQMMAGMLAQIAPILRERAGGFVLVSMAAGLTTGQILDMAGGAYPILRIMPNTPCAVGQGMVQYAAKGLEAQQLNAILEGMAPAGRWDALDEGLIDAASSVSGCGPAFAYLFIESLADGAVACGLPRAKAQEYAAQMALGAARMVLESGQHPGALKDAVCSPGGTTIQGVRALEEHGFRAAVQSAVIAAFEKSREFAGK